MTALRGPDEVPAHPRVLSDATHRPTLRIGGGYRARRSDERPLTGRSDFENQRPTPLFPAGNATRMRGCVPDRSEQVRSDCALAREAVDVATFIQAETQRERGAARGRSTRSRRLGEHARGYPPVIMMNAAQHRLCFSMEICQTGECSSAISKPGAPDPMAELRPPSVPSRPRSTGYWRAHEPAHLAARDTQACSRRLPRRLPLSAYLGFERPVDGHAEEPTRCDGGPGKRRRRLIPDAGAEKPAKGDFDKVACPIPGASKYMESAMKVGAVTGPLKNAAGQNGALAKLGMKFDTRLEVRSGTVTHYLGTAGGDRVKQMLAGVHEVGAIERRSRGRRTVECQWRHVRHRDSPSPGQRDGVRAIRSRSRVSVCSRSCAGSAAMKLTDMKRSMITRSGGPMWA